VVFIKVRVATVRGETGKQSIVFVSPPGRFCPEYEITFLGYSLTIERAIYIAFRDRHTRVSKVLSLRSILNGYALDTFSLSTFLLAVYLSNTRDIVGLTSSRQI